MRNFGSLTKKLLGSSYVKPERKSKAKKSVPKMISETPICVIDLNVPVFEF